jgi:predicted RNA binding protein YcfA (HicA-like mRNA interferase family)
LHYGAGERRVRVDELVRHLQDDGWVDVRQSAGFIQLRHGLRPGVLTIAGDPRAEVPAGTLRSVFQPVSPTSRRERAS